MDEYDKQYPCDPTEEEEMYYYEQQMNAIGGPEFQAELAGLDPKQRAE